MGIVGKGNSRTRPAELGYTPGSPAPCTAVRIEVTRGAPSDARRYGEDYTRGQG
jgi:hypothetical protein